MLQRAVFLDRDGVLNRAIVQEGRPHPPATPAELEILPGVPAALDRLREAGLLLLVVTNQPDIARGTTTRTAVDAIHAALRRAVAVDEVLVCPHDDADGCGCRKPRPGLLLDAAARHRLDLAASWMVGDRWRDVAAGQKAGCRTAFVDQGYAERQPARPTLVVADLPEAVERILAAG